MPIKSSGELSESQVIARCPQVTAVNQDSSFIHGHAIFERKADISKEQAVGSHDPETMQSMTRPTTRDAILTCARKPT